MRRESQQNSADVRRTEVESALAVALLSGGDSLPAWTAVWDLIQHSDTHAKLAVLETLQDYVERALDGDADVIDPEIVNRARLFGEAIEHSMRPDSPGSTVLPSKEVRKQYEQEQIEAHRKAMRDLGVRPGEGLPMWAMYMTRRSKRNWG